MRGRVDFRVGSFDDLVTKHGYYLDVYHAIQCPCLNPQTGHPDPTCAYCTNGWQYYGKQEVQGIISSLQAEKQFADTNGVLIGTMQLTVQASVELGYHDRVVNQRSVINFSELLTRGDGDTDKGRFSMIDIVRVVGTGGVIYAPLTDYEVDSGQIKWIGSNPPAAGSRYAIAYKMNPTWLVLSHVHVVRDTNIKFREPAPVHYRLPIQAVCKLEYLMED